MFAKPNQNTLKIAPPLPPNNETGNPPISRGLNFTNQIHSSGPQQLTSVRIKEPFGKFFVLSTSFALIAAATFTGYLFLSKSKIQNEITSLTAKKEKLMSEYQKPQNIELVSSSQEIVNKIKDLDQILNKRIEWTRILNEFNRETFKDVIYTDIAIAADGAMTVSGQTPSDESFAKLYRSWETSEIVQSVAVGTFTKQDSEEEGGGGSSPLGVSDYYSFNLTITLKPEIIHPDQSF